MLSSRKPRTRQNLIEKEITSNFQDKVAKLLGCNICLEMLDDPKVLHCTHSFCKTCLDSIMKFRNDGTAYIVCPLRCKGYTEIDKDQTTNVLMPSVQLRNLMEMLSDEIDGNSDEIVKKYSCDGSANCDQRVSYYCSCCHSMICSECKPNHTHGRNAKYTPIKSHRKDNDILPWCEKHSTFASYMCNEGFICIYCKDRDNHASHTCQKIETLSSEIKAWVNSKVSRLGDLENILTTAVEVTKDEIANIRKSLTKSLRNRKIKCLTEYLSKLNQEEEVMVKEFDQMAANHLKKYPSSKPSEFISNKPHFEVILKRENVVENFKKITKFPTLNVDLTSSSYDSYHPLGSIVWSTSGYLSFKNGTGKSSISSGIPEEGSAITDDQILIKEVQFETLLEEALKVNKENLSSGEDDTLNKETSHDRNDTLIINQETSGDRDYIIDTELAEVFTILDNDGFEYIKVLCENKRDDLLIEMVKLRRSIVEMRDCYDWTILHLAAKYNLSKLLDFVLIVTPIDVNVLTDNQATPLHISTCYNHSLCVKILLEHNCDVNLVSQDGRTAFQISQQYNYSEIKKLLLKSSIRRESGKPRKRKLQSESSQDVKRKSIECT